MIAAMNGPTQSYLFKERLLKCEPIDLGHFVIKLQAFVIRQAFVMKLQGLSLLWV